MTRKQNNKIALQWWKNNKKLVSRVKNLGISLQEYYDNSQLYCHTVAERLFIKQLQIESKMSEDYDPKMTNEIMKLWKIDNPDYIL